MNWLPIWDAFTGGVLRLFGFRPVWTQTAVGRVRSLVFEGGRGPDLVVLHGISAHGGHFWMVLPFLRRSFRRIVVPDLPGHGASDVPEVMDARALTVGLFEVLERLVEKPSIVYGNSLGALAAFRYAQRRPERVLALLLNSPGGAPESPAELVAFVSRFQLKDRSDGARFFDNLHRRDTGIGWLLAGVIRRKVMAPNIQALLRSITVKDLVTNEQVGALLMPVRLLWGRSDRLLPKHHFERWKEAMPVHAEVATPDMGHCPYLDTPSLLVDEIRSFATRTSRETGA